MMVSVASAWRLSLRVFVMTSIVGLSTGVLRSRKRSFVTQQQFLRSLSSRTVEYERVLSAKSFNTRRYPFYSQYKQFWSIRGGAEHSDQATIDISLSRKPFAGTIYPVSVCSIRGLRDHMEDDFVVASDFAAVFDGHGGDAVSKYLRQNLYASIQACLPSVAGTTSFTGSVSSVSREGSMDPKALDSLMDSLAITSNTTTTTIPALSLNDYEKAIVRAFSKVDREILRISHWSFQGSTAVACWILPTDLVDDADDESPIDNSNEGSDSSADDVRQNYTHILLTANIGDSRAILSRNKSSVIELTRDHKPNDPIEKRRIEHVGGTIVWHGHIDRHGNPILGTGVWRVNGNLALARAIGDRAERPAVSSEPELSVIRLTREDDFVLIATDGLWDVMTSADCVAFVNALIEETEEELDSIDYDAIASMLVEEALRRGSYDNITVVIIWLQDQQPKSGEDNPL